MEVNMIRPLLFVALLLLPLGFAHVELTDEIKAESSAAQAILDAYMLTPSRPNDPTVAPLRLLDPVRSRARRRISRASQPRHAPHPKILRRRDGAEWLWASIDQLGMHLKDHSWLATEHRFLFLSRASTLDRKPRAG